MREIKFEINEMALIGAPNIKTGIVIEISSVVKYKRKGRIPKNLLSLLLRFAKAIIDTINNTIGGIYCNKEIAILKKLIPYINMRDNISELEPIIGIIFFLRNEAPMINIIKN